MMGNPNPLKQEYKCKTCGVSRPPYQFYCDQHMEAGEERDASKGKPMIIDRIMKKILGR